METAFEDKNLFSRTRSMKIYKKGTMGMRTSRIILFGYLSISPNALTTANVRF